MHWTTKLLLPLILFLSAPSAVTAQSVAGRVLDGGTGEPVAGAVVYLLDGAGTELGSALTDGDGRFHVAAPAPGSYRLRSDRIGYASTFSEPFTLEAGERVTRELTGHMQAISLEGIRVEGERRCSLRPEEGQRTALLWAEARKALQAVTLTTESRAFTFGLVVYNRMLEPRSLQVAEEQRQARESHGDHTFVSLPPEELVEGGFVRMKDGAMTYFAPDADALLSDAFLDTHCLRVTDEAREPGLLGLEFEPVQGRKVTDIRGTLWLHDESAELRRLDYEYTGLPIETNLAGGEVVFERLPDGPWIVRSWRIRMPQARIRRGMRGVPGSVGRVEVLAVAEAAGEVVRIERVGTLIDEAEHATVAGTVIDSTTAQPLAGAEVFIDGTQYAATTDSTGTFRIEGVPAGRYAINFFHERSEALGVYPRAVEIEVGEMETRTVDLALSCSATPTDSRCRQVVAQEAAAAEREEMPAEDQVIALDPVEVTGERAADRARRIEASPAYYMDRGEIEELPPGSDFIRVLRSGRISGLRIRKRRRNLSVSLSDLCIENRRTHGSRTGSCDMVAVYVNGARVSDPGTYIEGLNADEVESVEFVPPNRASVTFGADGSFGVLLITTRSR